MTMPFRSLENAPLLEIYLRKKQRITTERVFPRNIEDKTSVSRGHILFMSCVTSRVIAFLIVFGKFFEYAGDKFESSFPLPWLSPPFHLQNQQPSAGG